MSPTRSSSSFCGVPPTINTISKLLLTLGFAVFVCCFLAVPSHAQGTWAGVSTGAPLSCGTLTVNSTATCPIGVGWYYYQNGDLLVQMSCKTATVSSCQGATDGWQVTIGYLSPAGVIGTAPAKGLIVLHSGDGGVEPASYALTDAYFRAGYEVVQIAWTDDWEMIDDPFPITTPATYGNIQNAACRPATVFNWVYNNLLPSVQAGFSQAGMCGVGASAGSAAVAYSLAYYGAYNWFDNVELLSGPVLSDISQGCQLPAAASVNVCGLQNCGAPPHTYQCGCQLGAGGSTWSLEPTYIQGAQSAVAKWTNDNTCNNTFPTFTSAQSEARWLAQSVVDQAPGGSNGAVPIYNYPKTAMSAWLCRSVHNPNN